MRRTILAGLGAALVLLGGLGMPMRAEAAGMAPERTSVGIEAGLPLVLGLDVTYSTAGPWRMGLALGKLGGLTALRGEVQRVLTTPGPRKAVPFIAVGAEQYFLRDGNRDATPMGLHAALGLEYHFDSPVSFGVRVGGLKTFGSSGGGDLKVFSVRNGFTSGTMSLALHYHF